ncbi:MAG TPA: ABC transporter permease subunit [Mycobacteriales bacterium]|nr:ABC transporter permease subunit [Mycobacteriales bacterium]
MTWVAFRQIRMSTAVSAALVLAAGLLLGVTGPHLSHLYAALRSCSGLSCGADSSELSRADLHVRLIGPALVAVPLVLGVFLGAPLVSRELESGTYRLAWTQSVSRTRWLVTRIGVGALVVALAAGLLTFAFTWWSIPLDHTDTSRIDPAIFSQRGIVPVAYALFAYALGVAAGAVLRRTLAAMAVTLGGFVAVRMVMQLVVRQHLLTPLTKAVALTPRTPVDLMRTSNGVQKLVPHSPDIGHAWTLGTTLADSSGHPPTSAFIRQACSAIMSIKPPASGIRKSGPPPPQVLAAVRSCVHNVGLSYHEVVSYQPASRFWAFQWLESAIFVGLAVALLGLAVYWVRRRLV